MTDERLIYEILAAVSEIPPGCVATYGQLARLIGREKNARLVGRVLRDASLYGDYPCHRVVNHAGRLAPGWPEQAELLRDEGYKVSERRISVQELFDAHDNGTLRESFGTGTAAVISPIGSFEWNGRKIKVADGGIGEISQMLYDTLTGIQTGKIKDEFGWTVRI